jgi:hypothetical protein
MVSNTIVRKDLWVRIPHPAPRFQLTRTSSVSARHDDVVVPHIRPQSVVDSALAASDAGTPDKENARIHGVAIKTIRRWRRDYQRRGKPRGQQHLMATCPKCTEAPLPEREYVELLGWYLGDGHISRGRRDVYNLHIFNDLAYPLLNAHIQDLMRAVKPACRPHTRRLPGCLVITVSWKHWPCLFPQHGPGRKHERPLVMQDWQWEAIRAHPGDFPCGLFHSDGARVNNWATKVVRGERRRYDYPRWQFVNRSEDILGWCGDALDLAEVPWRRSNTWTLSVSRRAAVQRLDELVGPKA